MIVRSTLGSAVCCAVLMFCSGAARGQQAPPPSQPPPAQVERVLTAAVLGYRGVAVQQERGLTPRLTLLGGVGAHYSSFSAGQPPVFGTRFLNVVEKQFGRSYTTSGITPYVFAEARIYANLNHRSKHGHDTRANAGTYLAAVGEMPFAPGDLINVDNLQLAYPVGLKVGMRRNLGAFVYLEGSIGAMLKISHSQRELGPRLDLAFGFH